MRYIKFHWKLFLLILACVLLLCTTFFKPPRETLWDIASGLESGQFICEDGTIWQILGKEGYTSYATVQRVGEIAPETILHEFGNRVTEPMGTVEYAQRVSEYGNVWVDCNGEVWKPSGDGSHIADGAEFMYLVPYLELSEVEAELSRELSLEMKPHSLFFKIPLGTEDEYCEECKYYYTLSLLLADGWKVVSRGPVNHSTASVKTGTAVYTFDNGNTTTYPVYEEYYSFYGNLENTAITEVPGRYHLKVYAEQDGKAVQLAEYDMTTEIKGKTLYINETAAG